MGKEKNKDKKNTNNKRNIFKRIIAAAAVLMITASLSVLQSRQVYAEGHSVNVDVSGKDAGYSAVLYDNTSGLPTSEANAVTETEEGFIWIGSYSGLIRYDGETFERIDSTHGVASVVSLFADSRNRLWVGTNDSGAAVMEKGEFTMINKKNGLSSLSVRAICEDNVGNIYVGTTQGVGMIDNDLNVTAVAEKELGQLFIRDLRLGADGLIYGVTMDSKIFTLKDGKLVRMYKADELGIPDVLSLTPDPDKAGYVYVGTQGSAVYYGKPGKMLSKKVFADVSPLASVKSIEKFGDQIWICSDSGIGMIKDGKLTVLDNVPLDNSVDHVMTDYEGNLWFTSSRQGIMKIVRNRFLDLFEGYGLSPAVVNSTCLDGDKLYLGTDSGLLILDEKRKKRVKNELTERLDGVRIRSVIRDSRGRMWISTYGETGLLRIVGGTVKAFTVDDGLPSDRVRTVCEKKDGSVLAVCTGGAAVIQGNKITEVYDESYGIRNTEILTAVEADNGDIILGTDGDGIYIIRDDKIRHISVDEGLSSDVVMRIKKDRKRSIFWIVTSNSIGYLDSARKVHTISNFPYSNNFDIYENDRDEMWVLSSNGIHVIAADKLIDNKTVEPVFYGIDNGLPCIATANSYSYLSENGDLYIAGTTGAARVNINDDADDIDELKMAVPFVRADGIMYYPGVNGTIKLPPGPKKLTVYCYVYNYSLVNPDVTYYLDGFETHRTTVSRSELVPIDYTNLPGGDYRFEMRISDSMGHDDSEFIVPIKVRKAFYEQIWFLVLVIAAVLALMVLMFRFAINRRTRAFLKKEAENKEYIKEVTEAFAKTIDMKDKYTNGHSMRVAEYTVKLAEEMGYSEDEVEKFYRIALLHDIGKIGVPGDVLSKPGKLTDEEFALIKSHAELGYNVLKDISIMPELAIGAGDHHERPDGRGYPKGLKGDEIPPVARIIAVADTFDAMYSDRPYRRRMNFDKVVSIIKEVSGTQLSPEVVDAFLRLVDKGEFRAADDFGGGSTEDIDNIHKRFEAEQAGDK